MDVEAAGSSEIPCELEVVDDVEEDSSTIPFRRLAAFDFFRTSLASTSDSSKDEEPSEIFRFLTVETVDDVPDVVPSFDDVPEGSIPAKRSCLRTSLGSLRGIRDGGGNGGGIYVSGR